MSLWQPQIASYLGLAGWLWPILLDPDCECAY